MTKKELSQLFYLNKEIAHLEERVALLKEASTDTSSKITGLPFCGGISDKTAIVAETADVEAIIAAKQFEIVAEKNRLMRYIMGVDDSFMRQILELRFVKLKSWKGVANEIGGNNTEDSVKKACYRFLRKN